MSCEPGAVFFLKQQMRYTGNHLRLPSDILRKICSMSFVPQKPIVDEILTLSGVDNCKEIQKDYRRQEDYRNPMDGNLRHADCLEIYDCCQDQNIIRYDEQGNIIEFVINHYAQHTSQNGDWDDFDPHKECINPVFELPKSIGYLRKLEVLEFIFVNVTENIPIELGYLRNLKTLTLICENNSFELSNINLPHTLCLLTNLETLVIKNYDFKNSDIEIISELSNLKQLVLHSSSDEDKDFSPLLKLKNLENLEIMSAGVDIFSFSEMKKLRRLNIHQYLQDGNVNINDFTELLFVFPCLEEVVSNCIFVGNVNKKLFEHPTLKNIDLFNYSNSDITIDFTNGNFPECQYSGEICLNPNIIGEIPHSYQQIGIEREEEFLEGEGGRL